MVGYHGLNLKKNRLSQTKLALEKETSVSYTGLPHDNNKSDDTKSLQEWVGHMASLAESSEQLSQEG